MQSSWAGAPATIGAADVAQQQLRRRQQQKGMNDTLPGSPEEEFGCWGDAAAAAAADAAGLPALRVEALLRSRRPRRPTDVTILTQLSAERLPMLRRLCGAWISTVSAAVYLPLLEGYVVLVDPGLSGEMRLVPAKAMKARLQDFHKSMEQEGGLWGWAGVES